MKTAGDGVTRAIGNGPADAVAGARRFSSALARIERQSLAVAALKLFGDTFQTLLGDVPRGRRGD